MSGLTELDAILHNMCDRYTRNIRTFIIYKVDSCLIAYALSRTRGNQSAASRLLGVNRNTFHKRVTQRGISVRLYKRAGGEHGID